MFLILLVEIPTCSICEVDIHYSTKRTSTTHRYIRLGCYKWNDANRSALRPARYVTAITRMYDMLPLQTRTNGNNSTGLSSGLAYRNADENGKHGKRRKSCPHTGAVQLVKIVKI